MTSPTKKPTLIVSGAVLEKDGRYLLVQETLPWVYGKWALPAGRLDPGETLEQTAVREVKEECGFDIELTNHLLTLHVEATERRDKYDHAELHAYAAKIIGGELRFPPDEILDARWFSYEEIRAMQSRGEIRAPEYALGAIEELRATHEELRLLS